ncbi:MAG: pyruvate dehydrogenase (acetyl-transferring), homodimeric type [Verrucomicrobia bacterium]|nr:pyruvate dehydrogenase (acetyl-transferring), homodimeric type [Verrucomicrobiota bacterium]MDE3099249.1 pyruvate dehydrogenase (acetyl-transferring), homodimeric type [Verrucomicrobiota bacterium]
MYASNGPSRSNGGVGAGESLESAFDRAIQSEGPEHAAELLEKLAGQLRAAPRACWGVATPYVNTIAPDRQPQYPGDWKTERRIKSLMRWNAMAMVVKANSTTNVGGHISTYASSATLYEVGFNHFFRGRTENFPGDIVYFQGHASPGMYARAFLEGRLEERHLQNFRQELAEGGGLSSYPHPYLMPDFWQFPTVSMGLGPILSLYQGRFNRYLRARQLVQWDEEPKIWAFLGDGECDEPETLGAITLGARESLDNLIWVINCNLQRLDGPVRGNGKIIQELEGLFRGAGWNVIKVIWGTDWDELLARDKSGLLLKRMEEAVDGDYQKYSVEPGSYTRRHFFGKYPELLELVNHLTDDQIRKLLRGGHDTRKVYAAYRAAVEHKGQPTVILAKTVKGYGLGEAGEGRNITHQQKKLNEKELREFRGRFEIPIADEVIAETPFYRPPDDSAEMRYLLERRRALGGFLPARIVNHARLETPDLDYFAEFFKGSVTEASTTMAFVRLMSVLLRHKGVGRHVVPIIPDEARTFGLDALFREIGIYSSKGQLYEPVDKASLLYYHEAKDGQILEEGITESGSMASFVAAGASYATLGAPMIPFYIYYSMFGPQRCGDLFWLAGDMRARGFLLGATAGRTTLNGEGLQHQDGHSLLHASTIPTCLPYDAAFGYELAVIIADGLRRMFSEGEDIVYYLALYNENYPMPPMPAGCAEGILKGLYKFKPGPDGKKPKAHIFGSGPIIHSALKAQEILADRYNVSADVWSATSYKLLRTDAIRCQRWNMLHPGETRRKSYLEKLLESEQGAFVAVSDNIRTVPDQIAPWTPGGLFTLGTDGFGRSDTRARLRRFFEVDAEATVVGTLHALAEKKLVGRDTVAQAIKDLGMDSEKAQPQIV